MVLPDHPSVRREFPGCTVLLTAIALVSHTACLIGNQITADSFFAVGQSSKGWSNVGLNLAKTLNSQMDKAMLNVTEQLTGVLNNTMDAKTQLDNAFYMIGNITDMVMNATSTSLLELFVEGHDPSSALLFERDVMSAPIIDKINEAIHDDGQIDPDRVTAMLTNSIQSHKERVKLLHMQNSVVRTYSNASKGEPHVDVGESPRRPPRVIPSQNSLEKIASHVLQDQSPEDMKKQDKKDDEEEKKRVADVAKMKKKYPGYPSLKPNNGSWSDIGEGCCSAPRDTKNGRLFAAKMPDLASCQAKCEEFWNCGVVEYGYSKPDKEWCFIWSSKRKCDKLANKKTDCGGRGGDNGVRSYKYNPWIKAGDGCCKGTRDIKGGRWFAGKMPSLEACQDKCTNVPYCGAVEYGWKKKANKDWCFIWSNSQMCTELDTTDKGCGGKGGSDGVAVYKFKQWSELGPGCCSANPRHAKNGKLYAGEQDSLQACQAKCTKFGNCGVVEYGWTKGGSSKWCFIWSNARKCDKLDSSKGGCGGRGGDNGVTSYKFLGVSTATLTTTPITTWTNVGPGCCNNKKRDAKGGRIYAGKQPNVTECQAQCTRLANCGFIEYGWGKKGSQDFCFIWSNTTTCKPDKTKKACGTRGGDNGVRLYKYNEWADLGKGCCSANRTDNVSQIYAGSATSLDDCKGKCKDLIDCGHIEYGWNNSDYCFIWSKAQGPACDSLATGKKDCGGKGGDNGVRSYRFIGVIVTTTTTTTTTTTFRFPGWTDLGAGCCDGERDDPRRLFAANLPTLDACLDKCTGFPNCGIVEYGWSKMQPEWCFIWNSSQPCDELQTKSKSCGGRGGDNGVHAYLWIKGTTTTTTTTTTTHPWSNKTEMQKFTDLGAGCCDAPARNLTFGLVYGEAQPSIDHCKAQCIIMKDQCAFMEYGYMTGENETMLRPTNWCAIWNFTMTCETLNVTNTSCGGMGGDSGVHAYRYAPPLEICNEFKLDCKVEESEAMANDIINEKLKKKLLAKAGDMRGVLYTSLQNVTNITMGRVSGLLQKFADMIEPALLQVGEWLGTFSEKVQSVIEGFGTTMDKVSTLIDQVMSQIAQSKGKKLVEYDTFTLFDMGGSGYVTVQDLQALGKSYGIQALDGDKSVALFTKYDQDMNERIDQAEFSRLVEDDSVPGCMCIVLRAYSKRLAQIAGNIKAARLRDEVAKAVVEYMTHISAKNRTKVQWISERLTNGSVPMAFTADILKQLAQQVDDPSNVSTADIGQLVIAEMIALNSPYVSDTVTLMSDPEFWDSEGFDPTDQAALVERVTTWVAGAVSYWGNLSALSNVFQDHTGLPHVELSFGQRDDKVSKSPLSMPAMARKIVQHRVKVYQATKRLLHAERMQQLQEPNSSSEAFIDTFLGGTPASATNEDPTAVASVNSGVPAVSSTLEFAKFLANNASETASRFQDECMDYMGESTSSLDSFGNGIQAMTSKMKSFLQTMKEYSTPTGVRKLKDQMLDFDKYAVQGIMDYVDAQILGPASLSQLNGRGTFLLGMPRQSPGFLVTPVFSTVSTVLNVMQGVLPVVIADLKFARTAVSSLSAQMKNVFDVASAKAPPIFDRVAVIYKTLWTSYYVFFVLLTLSLLWYAFWTSGWFGGPGSVTGHDNMDGYEYPQGFQDRLRTGVRSCCVCLRAGHDTQLCFWSCVIFMEVIVLLLFANAIILSLLGGIKAFINSGCTTVYLLGDSSICTGVLQTVQKWLSQFWTDGSLANVCDQEQLMTCMVITHKLKKSVIMTTLGSLVAAISSFQLVIQSSILHEQARWRKITDEIAKDV